MCSKGYEDEVLNLMYKIYDRRQKEKGNEGHRMTKFDKEMKKLEWNVKDKGRNSNEEADKGTRTL